MPRVPHDLETICLKCLEKAPPGRYQSAQELADELDRFLRDEPIRARPITRAERTWRWGRRKPALASLSAATVVLLLTVAIGSPIGALRIDRERQRAEQNLYDANMSLAQHKWDEGDLGRTLSLLEAIQPRPGAKADCRGFEWFYFSKLCEGEQRMTLRGHSQTVNCVALSPDGKRLATGAAGDPVRIWDTATGKLVKTLPEPNVVSLAFGPEGQTLGVGGRDQAVVWDLESERAVFKQEDALGQFRISFSPVGTLLVIGKRGGQLHFHHKEYVTSLAYSPNGKTLASASYDGTIKLWNSATRREVASLRLGSYGSYIAFSPDGQTLAAWGDCSLRLWRAPVFDRKYHDGQ
jgi:eukaryotic-like serine/threonine-protein kinase